VKVLLLFLTLLSCDSGPAALAQDDLADDTEKGLQTLKAADIEKHQVVLSDGAMEGREAGSDGGHKAAVYIAEQLKKYNLHPGGAEGTYFQPFGELQRKPLEKGKKNIIAVWPGSDQKLKDEFVVIGAHYDHVGRGRHNSNGGKVGEVHKGADDNASGASTVLDIALAVSLCRFRRTVVCMWFDAEEYSLEGSRYWASNPTLPVEKCFAMINCDMIGRNDPKKLIIGVEKDAKSEPKYPKWVSLLKDVEKKYEITWDWSSFDSFIKRSDHWPFMEKGVPAMFFTAGLHADYHKETDNIEKINFAKEEKIGKIAFTILSRAANLETPLK
jgi:Zn-dependent M28 family amino/carboxypeptidase